MRHVIWFLFFICATAGSAAASGYDDFTRGMSENFLGEHDAAIAAFTTAIAASDLNPVWLPQAHRFRAVAYLAVNQCAPALADLDATLKLKPGLPEAVLLHATASLCLKKFDQVLADETALIDAGYPAELRTRGLLRWRMGDISGAAGDFNAYGPVLRGDGYATLWLAVLQARMGAAATPAQVTISPAADASQVTRPTHGPIDAAGLPGYTPDTTNSDAQSGPRRGTSLHDRLLRLFANQLKPEDILRPTQDGVPLSASDQCEAEFYVGEWWSARGDTASARALLKSAATGCPQNKIEHDLAQAELARLRG